MASKMVEKGVKLVVGLLVTGLLTAFLAPIFMDELNAVDTSSWSSAESALFGILGLFFILAIMLFVVQYAMGAADMN